MFELFFVLLAEITKDRKRFSNESRENNFSFSFSQVEGFKRTWVVMTQRLEPSHSYSKMIIFYLKYPIL